MSDSLVVNEIYLSLQGESTLAGLPCVFVRLTACNLRCSYCDSAYAFAEGRAMTLPEVLAEVRRLAAGWPATPSALPPAASPEDRPPAAPRLPLVELTGGEPLLQRGALPLMTQLCDEGFTVLLETSGAHDISAVDRRVRRIMDLKCPSSGECERNRWENLAHLRPTDELKFVIASHEDYVWARAQVRERHLAARCPVLFSWAHPLSAEQRHPSLKPVPPGHRLITRQALAELILADALPVRFQVQMHKVIWPPDQRGV